MKPNRRRVKQAVVVPLDVRLMNATSLVLWLVFTGMSLALLLNWLMQQNLFQLRAISLQGDLSHYNAAALRSSVVPKLSGNFITVDLGRAQAAFEAAPWVRKAVVQREFPNRLRVVLQEQQAIAFWGEEGDMRLVNTFGEVFEASQGDVEADNLPLLSGPQNQAALVLQGYRMLAPEFEKINSRLNQLELTRRGSWRARLDDGAALELGHGSLDEILARTKRFAATLTQVASQYDRELESADLRYGNGYAIRLRGVTTPSLNNNK
jgi:cell division protein FtsQ